MTKVVSFYKRKACAICGKPSLQQYHPFCSDRCKDVDLNRWLGGHYAIAAVEENDSIERGEEPEDESRLI